MDNVIRVNVVNFITVGLMAFVMVFLINYLANRFFPMVSLAGSAHTDTSPAPL